MHTKQTSKGIISFLDIDGDGLPDKLFKAENNDKIYYRKLLKPDNNNLKL